MASLGSFSNGGLGMGVAFTLEDHFSKTADVVESRLGQLSMNTDAISNSINRSMNMIKTGMGMAGVGAAILAPFALGVENASDFEENINKTEVAFGKYADRVKEFGNNALENYGIDKIMALDMASLFGDMGTGMGFGQEQAAIMSETLVGLAGDLSSFKNISADVAKNALKGVFTGETESLKGLGIVMTEANLAQYALSQGITKQMKDMTQAEKVQLRFNFVMNASKNAMGDFARTSDGYANSKRIFQGSIKEMSASLGSILMPMLASTFQSLSGVLKKLNAFSQTKAGKFIMQVVFAIGAFLLVGGLALMLIGGMRIGMLKMASAFGADTKAKIINTIATKGLSAGLRQMGVAAWASLGPYALIVVALVAMVAIMYKAWDMVTKGSESMAQLGAFLFWILGPIGWIVGAIAGITRGFSELKKPLDEIPTTGILGFFTRVAGVIEAVQQIWSSWNGETFTMTQELEEKLQKLGILDFVLSIGRGVVRIKNFFMGMGEALQPLMDKIAEFREFLVDKLLGIWERIKNSAMSVWGTLSKAFKPLTDILSKIWEKLFGSAESLGTWADMGRAVGNVILGVFTFIIDAIMFVIEIIAFLVEGFIWLWGKIIEGVIWVASFFINAWITVGSWLSQFFDWILSLPERMILAGVNFVLYLIEGIQSMWASLTSWISEKVDALVNSIVQPLKDAWDWVAGNDPENEDPAGGGKPKPVGGGGGYTSSMHHQQTSKTPIVYNNNNSSSQGGQMQPIIMQNFVDGDLISEKMIERQDLSKARKG